MVGRVVSEKIKTVRLVRTAKAEAENYESIMRHVNVSAVLRKKKVDDDTPGHRPENSGQVKHLGDDKRHVADDNDNHRFHDADVMSESRQETSQHSQQNANTGSSDYVNDK